MKNILIFLFLFIYPLSLYGESPFVITSQVVYEKTMNENLEVQMAQMDYEIGSQDLLEILSIYDTLLAAETSYNKDQSQKTSTVFGTDNSTTIYNFTLAQKTPLGTELGFGFLNERGTTDSIFATVNPAYESQLAFELRQPVLKNILGYTDRKKVQIVKKSIQALNYQTQAIIQAKVYENLVHYWNFYWATSNLNYESEALKAALDLLKANQNKKEMGLIEASDLEAFLANYHTRQALYLEAKNSLVSATEQIRQDLSLDASLLLKPGNESFDQKMIVSFDLLLLTAMNHRPDYLALQEELKAANLQVKHDKNSLWPKIDLVGSLSLNGIDSDYGEATQNIGEGHANWTMGMEFEFPLQNRVGRSQAKRSQLQRAKKLLELKQKEQEIIKEVTEKFSQFKNAKEKMVVAQNAKIHQYQKFLGELQKQEQGRSDSDMVIRYQNDYIDAKKLALKAQIDFRIALIELLYVQGKLVE